MKKLEKLEKLVQNVFASYLIVSAMSLACLSSKLDGSEYIGIAFATLFMSYGTHMFKEFFKGGE